MLRLSFNHQGIIGIVPSIYGATFIAAIEFSRSCSEAILETFESNTEAYLELSRKPMMELFCKNS